MGFEVVSCQAVSAPTSVSQGEESDLRRTRYKIVLRGRAPRPDESSSQSGDIEQWLHVSFVDHAGRVESQGSIPLTLVLPTKLDAPSLIDFGSIEVGKKAVQRFYVRGRDGARLKIGSCVASDPKTVICDYAQSKLANGVQVMVEARPTDVGNFTGEIRIESADRPPRTAVIRYHFRAVVSNGDDASRI